MFPFGLKFEIMVNLNNFKRRTLLLACWMFRWYYIKTLYKIISTLD